MTYLEKYKQDHPYYKTLNCNGLPGGDLCDCPSDHCYEDADTYIYGGCCHQDLDCRACWNREMPEEDGGENMNENILKKEPEKTRYIRIAVDEDTYLDIMGGAESTHIVVGPENVVESEPIVWNDACENITPELVADLRTKLRALESENATLKECIIRMTLRMNELY